MTAGLWTRQTTNHFIVNQIELSCLKEMYSLSNAAIPTSQPIRVRRWKPQKTQKPANQSLRAFLPFPRMNAGLVDARPLVLVLLCLFLFHPLDVLAVEMIHEHEAKTHKPDRHQDMPSFHTVLRNRLMSQKSSTCPACAAIVDLRANDFQAGLLLPKSFPRVFGRSKGLSVMMVSTSSTISSA